MAIAVEGKDLEQVYFAGSPASTTDWSEKLDFGFRSDHMKFNITGTGDIEYSFDGKEVAGKLSARATSDYDFFGLKKGHIYIRGAATAVVRGWAWL
jgi:hypothetical protein